ncbi:MAG: M23 family metallopeptidase [Melioribacteraceae bacterium]|nr:M23 family metallopeptidase [Melioribacteraceae bacterium]
MNWFSLKDIKESSVYVTPNFASTTTKRFKFTILALAGYGAIAIFLIGLLTILMLAITPLGSALTFLETTEIKEQKKEIQLLEKQVLILSEQVESISSVNKRLKMMMMLAGSDKMDTSSALYDSLKQFKKPGIKISNNIYVVFIDLVNKYFTNEDSLKILFFLKPINGIQTQKFKPSNGHLGIDYGAKIGTPIYASLSGTVIHSGYSIEYGYSLIIQSGNYLTMYKHCSELIKKDREFVSQGELIALSGNSGSNTSGPHLHFEIWENGKAINPDLLLSK